MAASEPVAAPEVAPDVPPGPGLFVIQNPAAGARHPERLRRRIESALTSRRVIYEHAYTREPGHGAELAREALESGFRTLLVAGGDGTVLEAVSALAGTDASLALLPVGTGNQLAANLGLPRGLGRSLEVAVSGRVKEIDVGLIDGRPFSTIAGAGFDAEVVRPEPRVKRRVGYLAYVHAAARAALSPRSAALRVRVDDELIEARGVGVEVMNMPGLTGPGLPRPLPVAPRAVVDDGLLDVCVLAAETTLDCIVALGSIIGRRYDRDRRLRYLQGSEIHVDADPPLQAQADGELLGTTPFVASVRPRALRVMVPHSTV